MEDTSKRLKQNLYLKLKFINLCFVLVLLFYTNFPMFLAVLFQIFFKLCLLRILGIYSMHWNVIFKIWTTFNINEIWKFNVFLLTGNFFFQFSSHIGIFNSNIFFGIGYFILNTLLHCLDIFIFVVKLFSITNESDFQ